ncbi:transporter, partial [Bosea sp. (in: a-proteobacteria)]|uniref:transporter n=1 Tax=Bosea sp. (in: a-proteobacteria) TaxID=1871050 RepID=UPI002FC74220
RSLIRRTASILNSRPNFRRCICHLRLHETPNRGVHETGSRPDYRSGNAIHADLAISQYLTKEFSVGLLASHYQQITGDGGSGASLGAHKGRVTALGGTVAYNFSVAGTPVSARLKVLREVNVEDRFRGTIAMVSLAFPIGFSPATSQKPAPAVIKH